MEIVTPDYMKEKEALDYHAFGRPGKIEVQATKPTETQNDLSLAYSPGVAAPCLAIAENKENVYKYTAKGNLVAVISNGTAVLGLGNIGAESMIIQRFFFLHVIWRQYFHFLFIL